MTPNQPLATGALVWAKVEPYPWWPGRILKSILQHKQPVYKIAFFADPTYTYLHQHQILPFQAIDPSNSPDHQQPSSSLHKAVRMAQAYQDKLNAALDCKADVLTSESPSPPSLPSKKEESCEQNSMISSEREGLCSQLDEQPDESMAQEPTLDQITTENVLKLVQRLSRKKVRPAYCYEKRKEQVKYQDKLKQQLLRRYSLLDIDSKSKRHQFYPLEQSHLQKTGASDCQFPQKRHKKISKQHNLKKSLIHDHIQTLTKRCAQKIHSILKNNRDSHESTRYHSMEIVRRMLLLADNNHLKLKSLFVTLVKTMSRSLPVLNCSQQLSDFNHYLDRLEGEKGEDEEGSRVTQIDTSLN